MRFYVDYRRVNAITKKDVYPLLRRDDILDTLDGTKYFSTLDLCSGYWQIELDPVTRDKSAFTTHCGLFEFTRMPFGLCNAPATFQRLMQTVLAGLEGNSVLCILMTFSSVPNHLRSTFNILNRYSIGKAGLILKPKSVHSFRRKWYIWDM